MNTIITSTWETIIQYFFPIFTVPTTEIFLNLATGWVLCTARHTITGILPFADPAGQKTHDAYHRFFPDASWAMSELWRLLTILLVMLFYPTGVIPTDTTLTAAEVIGGFAGRWSIEDTFKNTKQLIGGQDLRLGNAKAPSERRL